MRDVNNPFLTPYLLKGVLTKNGFESKVIDLNKLLCNHLGLSDFSDEDCYLEYNFKEFVKNTVNDILSLNPIMIGFSMMSFTSYSFTKEICKEIRKKDKKVTISIGGPGSDNCYREFLSKGLIDFYVKGDGEKAILEVLKGSYKNSNKQNIVDINKTPFADFSDLENKNFLNIQGSRGCIGKCSFCNVNSFFGKYRCRNGRLIASEMIYHNGLYGTKRFSVIDNAVNLSEKNLQKLCSMILSFYKDEVPFTWFSHATAKLNFDPEILRKSGCYKLMVGIESGSQRVLDHMNKNLNISDVMNFIEKCVSSGIKLKLYFTVGYPIETDDDFKKTLNLISDIKSKFDEKVEFRVVYPIKIWKNSKLHEDNSIVLGKEKFGNFDNWIFDNNTKDLRMKRFEIIKEII